MAALHPGVLGAAAYVLAAGVTVCAHTPPPGAGSAGTVAAAAAAALAAVAWARRHPLLARLCLVSAAVLLALARAPRSAPVSLAEPRPVALQARILAWHAGEDDGWGWADRVRTAGGRRLPSADTRLLVLAAQPRRSPPVGAVLALEGLLRVDGGRPRLARASWRVLRRTPLPPVPALRQAVGARLQRRLPPDAAGVARALLLGDRRDLPEPLRDAYRRFGLLHLLAVSGLHLWLWDAAWRLLGGGRATACRWALLAAAALLAGARPPVMRALTAILLRDAAARAGLAVPALSLWAAALGCELALQPAEPHGLGLTLSYAATFFLIAGAPPPGSGRLRRVLQPSAVAFLGAMPWLHAVHGTVEPWSVPFSPLFALLLPLRLTAALAALLPGLAAPAAVVLEATLRAELGLFEALSALPASPWMATRHSTLRLAAVSALGLAAAVAARRPIRPESPRPRRRAACCAAAAVLVAAVPLPAPARPGLAALQVGHGLAVVIAGERRSLAFDLGSRAHDPAALVDRVYLPALQRRRWPVPDRIVLSHGDDDHVNGLPLLRARVPLRELRVPAGGVRRVAGLRPWSVSVYGCRAARRGVSNAAGHVIEARAPGFRAVLLGDQFGYALRDLARRLDPGPVDLLLLPHHGLTTEGLGELLARLRPRRCWSSSGAANFPLPVAGMLERRGIPWETTLRADLDHFLQRRDPEARAPSSP